MDIKLGVANISIVEELSSSLLVAVVGRVSRGLMYILKVLLYTSIYSISLKLISVNSRSTSSSIPYTSS